MYGKLSCPGIYDVCMYVCVYCSAKSCKLVAAYHL